MRKVAPSKVPLPGGKSKTRGMLADAKIRLSPLGSKRRLNVESIEAQTPNALDTTPLGSPASDARAMPEPADGSVGSGGADVTRAGELNRTDVNSSSGDSSSEGQQLASLQQQLEGLGYLH